MNLSQIDAAARPLALRVRGDLEFRPQRYGAQRYWAVKDPVALKYFHLGQEEYALLTMLDGQSSVAELKHKLDQVFAPRRVSMPQVHGYLAALHRWGLVQADVPGQGRQLVLRKHERRLKARLEALAGVLAIRFPGVNPQRLLDVVYPLSSWLFSPASYFATAFVALVAVALVALEFHAIEQRLPQIEAILAAANLPLLALALAGVKVLHELGHAVAARKFGSNCHEIGVMLLVFTPCMYCNVSDAWMLPSKWQRIAISAAGMYIELILASACTLLWYSSAPGLFNSLCLNVVLICSVGTLLLNGNPLMRYDGYFILSDLVAVPNLRAEATAAFHRVLARYGAGVELPPDRLAKAQRPWRLILYALAANVYRFVLIGLVLWAIYEILHPLHLEVLVWLLGGILLGGMIWPPSLGFLRWSRDPVRKGRLAPLRLAASAFLVACVFAAIAWVPISRNVAAPVVLEYADAERLYVTVDGTLVEAISEGAKVSMGQQVARLANPQVEFELAQLEGERDTQRLRVANLKARRLQGGAGTELPAAQAALDDLERRCALVKRDAERLALVASRDGVVLPAPNVPPEVPESHALPRWTGTPLDPVNRGTLLATGTLVCLVGEPDKFEAILHVDERDVELVQNGQQVSIRLDHLPNQTLAGSIVEISKLDLDVMPRELSAAGDLPAHEVGDGPPRPLDTWYQARVKLDGHPKHLVARMHGRAKISVASQTMCERLLRWLKQTFRG
jgi:putative peptide zinc metalloprotease protein